MVSEKEAFLRSVMKVVDGGVILLSFVLAYLLDGYFRPLLNLGEMAYAVSGNWEGILYFSRKNALLIVSSVPIWISLGSLQGLYTDFRTKPYWQTGWIVIKTGVLATVALGSVIFVSKMVLTSRFYIGVFTLTAVALLVLEKKLFIYFLDYIHRKGYNEIRLLIVGTGKRAREFIKAAQSHENWGLRIVGLIDDDHQMYGKEIEGFRVLGRLQDIPFILHRTVVDKVIFVVPRLWLNKISEAILACEREGVGTAISLDLYNPKIATVRQTNFNGIPLLEFDTFRAKQWQLFVKRTLDILIALIGLIACMPLFAVVALAIKTTSRGPILYRQTRCGLNGRKFTLYKFRSMIVGAEMKRRELEKMNEMNGPVFKIKRDPRITPVGRILRKFSIDELPQLWNVLKGDMSIVGPRPPLPVEVEIYEVWQRRRLSLKPGLTCIWQVSGRNKVDFDRWMAMDLEYIDHWSLWLDFKIMFKTLFVVLFGYGAS